MHLWVVKMSAARAFLGDLCRHSSKTASVSCAVVSSLCASWKTFCLFACLFYCGFYCVFFCDPSSTLLFRASVANWSGYRIHELLWNSRNYLVWISRLRARLNRGVARSGEPVDFTGLYMQVSFTNLSKEWRELWFSSRMWGEFRHLSCTIAYALGARLGGFLSDTRRLCKFEVPVYRVRELAFWRRLGDFSESFKLM